VTGTAGSVIRVMREARAWTVSDLAERAEVDAAWLGSIEQGEREPSARLVSHLARVLAT
jgi:transcriptional regulator with XRE-family HTH domain